MRIKAGFYNGDLPLVESPYLLDSVEVKLTWWQRIKSLKPWKKAITKRVPSEYLYLVDIPNYYSAEKVLIGHPQTIERLRVELDDRSK